MHIAIDTDIDSDSPVRTNFNTRRVARVLGVAGFCVPYLGQVFTMQLAGLPYTGIPRFLFALTLSLCVIGIFLGSVFRKADCYEPEEFMFWFALGGFSLWLVPGWVY